MAVAVGLGLGVIVAVAVGVGVGVTVGVGVAVGVGVGVGSRFGAVSPAGVEIAGKSAPDDHLAGGTGPHGRVSVSGIGRIGGAGGGPTISAGTIPSAGVQNSMTFEIFSAPDDHLAAGPDCSEIESAIGRVSGAGGCPTISAGIISAAGVESVSIDASAPDDHFAVGPHRGVEASTGGRAGCAGGCPTIGAGIISAAGVKISWCHHLRPRRSFRCRSTPRCERIERMGALVVLVAVQLSVLGLYLPPVLKMLGKLPPPQTIISLPVHTAV